MSSKHARWARILLHATSTISMELLYRGERERERVLDSRNFLCWPIHRESKKALPLDQVDREQRPIRLWFNSNLAKFSCMVITKGLQILIFHIMHST
jgi:hypothetical protein